MAAPALARGGHVSGVPFFKMTGSGNDFVLLDGRGPAAEGWGAERIAALCDRRNGVGADGLVILVPDDPGSVRMIYYNADGSRAAMCGNAALCSTRLAARLGMAAAGGMQLVTDAGVVASRCVGPGDLAEIRLPDCPVPAPVPAIAPGAGERAVWLGTVGVPHLVVLVDDAAAVDVVGRGRPLRYHPATGPAGANANFVAAPREPGGPWLIRTYERGVEGETLACGTGTVAAALALAAHCGVSLPLEFRSWGGEPLVVRATLSAGLAGDVWLGGQGRLVFRGEWEG
ncbi:MAG TPA: diaminopimelate epimerase [Gemmatimonadales bacterium]|nr:diaminopimelate epimerase [Gemmatimonadales bacterium]